MGPVSLLAIAFGLAMDAFSVAVASGIVLGKVSARQSFRLSFHFGLFQFAMPILGWFLGSLLSEQLHGVASWLAFALLAFVGAKMLREAIQADEEVIRADPTKGLSLLMLSIATSLDALAVGVSLGLVGTPVLFPSIVIGAVAGNMTLLGLHIGGRAGHLLGKRMEVAGALVLLGVAATTVV